MMGDHPESSCCAKRWKRDGFGFLSLDDDDVEAAPVLPGSWGAPRLPLLPPLAAATAERLVGADKEPGAAAALPLGSMGKHEEKGNGKKKKREEVNEKRGDRFLWKERTAKEKTLPPLLKKGSRTVPPSPAFLFFLDIKCWIGKNV
jgi:hypothetical protein